MATAFYEELGDYFTLITGSSESRGYAFPHKSIPFAKYRRFRYISACFIAAKRTLLRVDDVVFTRDIMIAAVVIALGGRAIYEAHKDPRGKLAHYIIKFLAKIDRFSLVSISQALSNYYRDLYAYPDKRRLVAHDGAFPEDYVELRKAPKKQLREELGLPKDKIIVVHTGSLYKGGAEFFGTLVDGREEVIFIQIGGSLTECEEWSRHYFERGIRNIVFIPHRSPTIVRKFQLSADLLFYVTTKDNPLYWCTSPLKLFEYMASGTPLVASNIGSIAEVIDNTTAVLFNPDECNSLKETLDYFINNRCEAETRAQRACELLSLKYTWAHRAKKILDFAKYRQAKPRKT